MRSRFVVAWAISVLVALFCIDPASAQSGAGPIELGAQVAIAQSSEFDANDTGFGGRVSWFPIELLGVDAEVNFHPANFPDDRSFSRARVEGLFGVTAGPSLGRVRPFARVRPGFLTFRPSEGPLACILIFPPPLNCTLATGRTLFALDLGGGVSVGLTPRASWRVDVGDRIVRYPAPVFDSSNQVRDESFSSHDFRVATGVGVRF
jgi:hypothetical protein